jgi:signal transduction histidine kinase/ActR/RegA family two-component response regulator
MDDLLLGRLVHGERAPELAEGLRPLLTLRSQHHRQPHDVASVVLEQSVDALDAAGGVVYALSADGRSLELVEQRGYPDDVSTKYASISLESRSPLADAARQRTPGFYESFERCAELYPQLRHALGLGGFEASVTLPLLTHGALLGAVSIRFRQPRSFDPNDRSWLLTLGELCAQALDRARLFAVESAARAGAESANRSKDEFLAMLGHELRSPLAPIVTALRLMKLRDGDASAKERMVIERQVSHLSHLVDDLLDIARITHGGLELKKERVELAAVVAKAVELSSELVKERAHELSISVASHGLAVDGDATRLAQVVSNLVSNAAKYTPPRGHIEIAAVRREERIVLTVRDDGIGIAPAMLARVFDLFAQEQRSTEGSRDGLGLGLAIVKRLVALHGGTVSAFSEGNGRGCVMTVELPAARQAAVVGQDSRAEAGTPSSVRQAKLRVLVVDDNEDAAEMLSTWLERVGHHAPVAHDGAEALTLAAKIAPHVVLLDIGLPGMDGFEVARRLRETARPAASAAPLVVAVTGHGRSVDRERSSAEGFHAHMVKPIDLDLLTRLLESVQHGPFDVSSGGGG